MNASRYYFSLVCPSGILLLFGINPSVATYAAKELGRERERKSYRAFVVHVDGIVLYAGLQQLRIEMAPMLLFGETSFSGMDEGCPRFLAVYDLSMATAALKAFPTL